MVYATILFFQLSKQDLSHMVYSGMKGVFPCWEHALHA